MELSGRGGGGIGSDCLFINGKPATASIMDLLLSWPYYIIYLELIGIVIFLLLYLPFIIKDWRNEKNLDMSQACISYGTTGGG